MVNNAKYPYLNDEDFLYTIDSAQVNVQYIKIISLNWKEEPLEEIEGKIIDGSLNINGDSAMRRTGSFTAAFDTAITDVNNCFSINKKIQIEIGYDNITSEYEDYPIIWYPQGTFVLTGCSVSHDTNNVTVSAQIQDKMCLLNGSCGGTIPAATQFDKYDTLDEKGAWVTYQPVVSQVIFELVNHFGLEQASKIIISDVDDRIRAVVRWLGSVPVYLIDTGTGGEHNYKLTTNSAEIEDLEESEYKTFNYNDDIGYIYMDFIINKEMTSKPGDSVCTILDQLVQYLGGNYEYFYDVCGNFIFQEKKNYINTSTATVVIDNMNNADYQIDMSKGTRVYDFTDKPILSSYSNSPQYNNIKNDYVVWGTRTTAEGLKLPIRFHLAIDTKPETGNIYEDVFFYEDEGLTKAKMPVEFSTRSAFPETGADGVFYKALDTSKIYTWQLNPTPAPGTYEYIEINRSNYDFKNIKTNDWRSELYLQGICADPLGIDSNSYYVELSNEWPKIYDLAVDYHSDGNYWTGDFKEEYKKNPSLMDFYLDFIDSSAPIGQFSVDNIGRRSIVEQKDDFNCVFEPEIPNFVIIETDTPETDDNRAECIARGQPYIQVEPKIYKAIGLGGLLNSCYFEVKMLLYSKTGYNESVQISGLPIWHLEPNIRIGMHDTESDIYGDYFIKTISLPFKAGGTMSISAIRVDEKL